jgi:hypothetical protein
MKIDTIHLKSTLSRTYSFYYFKDPLFFCDPILHTDYSFFQDPQM